MWVTSTTGSSNAHALYAVKKMARAFRRGYTPRTHWSEQGEGVRVEKYWVNMATGAAVGVTGYDVMTERPFEGNMVEEVEE